MIKLGSIHHKKKENKSQNKNLKCKERTNNKINLATSIITISIKRLIPQLKYKDCQ